jgi:hypothetical protein
MRSKHLDQFLAAAFFRKISGRAVRLDILERVEEALIDAARQGRDADQTLNSIVSLLGCGMEAALALAAELGWKREIRAAVEAKPVWQKMRAAKRARRNRPDEKPVKPNSPFAGLARLITAD